MLEFCDSVGPYVPDISPPATSPASAASIQRRWNGLSTGGNTVVAPNRGARHNPAFSIGFGGGMCKTFSHQPTYTWGERLNIGSLNGVGGGSSSIRFCHNGLPLASLRIDNSGTIHVYGNNLLPTEICATPSPVVDAFTDVYVEFQATLSADGLGDLSVSTEVRLNGVHVVRGSADIGRNVSTLTKQTATFNQVFIDPGVASNGQSYVSDIYLTNGAGDTNTGFLARASFPYLIVVPIFTISDTLDLAWTPSRAGTHWDLVNDNPADDDATYVAATTPGLVDSWNWQPIPDFAGTVRSVQLSLLCRSTDEGPASIQGNIGPKGLEQQTVEYGLCSSNFWRHQAFDKDPRTVREWTRQGFNTKPFGPTKVQ